MRLVLLLGVLGSAVGLGGAPRAGVVPSPFPLFDAGERVNGLPLTEVLHRSGPAQHVSFVYGDCTPADDGGCAPPVEIQVWPACRRNLHLYDGGPPGTPLPERTTVRGAPAAFFEDGQRLELQTSRSTIVVFATSRARALGVAGALRAVGKPYDGARLPPPDPGALEGTLGC
jgi:hypothetical protein